MLTTSTSVSNCGTSYGVNRRAVYRSLETGGYKGMDLFCSIMNMACMTHPDCLSQLVLIQRSGIGIFTMFCASVATKINIRTFSAIVMFDVCFGI